MFPTVLPYTSYLNSLVPWIAYLSYLNSLLVDFTLSKTKKKMSDGTEAVCISRFFVLCSHLSYAHLIKWLSSFRGKFMKNRQSIILCYKNGIRKVNKLSFDNFLKTISAEMNAPDPIFIYNRWFHIWPFSILRFHAKTLELYQAVCSHGNHRVANVLTEHVDEKQLMYCIKSECKYCIF